MTVESFGAVARELRERRGLSQAALAQRAGLHAGEVGRVERGVREPRLSTHGRLACGLGVTPRELRQA